MMDVFISLTVVTISRCIHTSKLPSCTPERYIIPVCQLYLIKPKKKI